MGPYAGIDYTSPYVDSNTYTMGNTIPESTLTLCQSRLYPPVRDLGWPRSTCRFLLPISQSKSSDICRSSLLLFVHNPCSPELLFGFTLLSKCLALSLFSLFKELTFIIRSSLLCCALLSSAFQQM
jgi:hypothetical protein